MKKRYLRNPKRKEIGDEVLRVGALQWRRQFADANMEYGDDENPILYNLEILRKAKQDSVDFNLGTSGPDPITSLIALKHSVEHSGSIHTICVDKFFVHYWSPLQCHVYKTIRKENWVTMTADATGSLIAPLQRTSNKIPSGHIFLYQLVVNILGHSVPIAQQLSEKHDTLSIYCWIANWIT